METASLIASIVSVIISVFAIWLSLTFYRLSSSVSEDTKEAAKSIISGVNRLEVLFDRLYTDTFSMVKDTVSDMRKHIWNDIEKPEGDIANIEKTADKKINDLRNEIKDELINIVNQVGHTDKKINLVQEKFTEVIDKTIKQTRKVEMETQEEISIGTIANDIINFIVRYEEVSIRRLLLHPLIGKRYSSDLVKEALIYLLRKNFIESRGNIENPDTVIKVNKPKKEDPL